MTKLTGHFRTHSHLLFHFHNNAEHFSIVDTYVYANNNERERIVVFPRQHWFRELVTTVLLSYREKRRKEVNIQPGQNANFLVFCLVSTVVIKQ